MSVDAEREAVEKEIDELNDLMMAGAGGGEGGEEVKMNEYQ